MKTHEKYLNEKTELRQVINKAKSSIEAAAEEVEHFVARVDFDIEDWIEKHGEPAVYKTLMKLKKWLKILKNIK